MSDVFISYSRKDSEFVQRLNTAFVNANRVVWLDWQDIARGEDWWREIQLGIEQADAFICVISENWLTSEVCHNELHYARQNNKRILPLIRQQMRDDIEKRVKGSWMDLPWEQTARENWDFVRHLNWIFFDQNEKFDSEFASLLKTLEEDQPHIKAHTRYQNRALEWSRSAQNPSFLLAGDDLTFAEKWMSDSSQKQPLPTDEHRAYIAASRTAEDMRIAQEAARERRIVQFRRWAIGLGVVGALAITATSIAVPTSINASNSNATSVAQVETATISLSTATQVAQRVATGESALVTAVQGQGIAETQAATAQTQVANAQGTLAQVPPTLTAAASIVADAHIQQDIAIQIGDASQVLAQGDNQYALKLADAMVEQYPDQYLAYLGRGLIENSMEQLDAALSDYNQAILLDPQRDLAYYNRASIYEARGNRDAALSDYNRTIQLNPQFADAYINRGGIYFDQGRFDEAIADFSQAVQIRPKSYIAYDNLGHAYYELGKLDEAIANYNQAIQINPQYARAYAHRGLAYDNQGEQDLAMADYTQAIQLDPQYAIAYYNRGSLLYDEGKLDDAFADFNHALQINPQYTNAYMGRANVYYSENQFSEALADYNTYQQLGGKVDANTQAVIDYAQKMLTPTPP